MGIRLRTWVPIRPPSSSYPSILLIDSQIDVAKSLRYPDSKINARVACPDDADLHGAMAIQRRIFEGER